MKTKKAQIEAFGGIAVAVITLAIMLVVAFLVMANTKTNAIEQITATSVDNQSITSWVYGTPKTLARECVAISNCALYNNSVQTVQFGSGNFTCLTGNPATINITNSTSAASTLYLDYSCKSPSDAYNATRELQEATATIPGWIPLIILVVIGSIVLLVIRTLRQ